MKSLHLHDKVVIPVLDIKYFLIAEKHALALRQNEILLRF